MKYTAEKQQLLDFLKTKVTKLFLDNPVPAHGIDHIVRVVKWTEKLIKGEKPRNPLLCELSAWLHDIGRLEEDNPGESTRKHHEISYRMLRKWFKEYSEFDILTKKEKIELLYSVRYHWNNEACKYDTAWILRDADKMDGFGKIGLKRAFGIFKNDEKALNDHFRFQQDNFFNVKTDTAKKIIRKKKMMEPFYKEYKKYLKSKIKSIKF